MNALFCIKKMVFSGADIYDLKIMQYSEENIKKIILIVNFTNSIKVIHTF